MERRPFDLHSMLLLRGGLRGILILQLVQFNGLTNLQLSLRLTSCCA